MGLLLKSAARQLSPPVIISLYRKLLARDSKTDGAIRFTGRYSAWQDAVAASDGYDDAAILERILKSSRAVRDGLAAFERDGVAFDCVQYPWPLLACLLRIASERGNRLSVVDFGGSLGSTYIQCRAFLNGLAAIRWNIVEQAHFVAVGQREFQTEQLRFYKDLDSCFAEGDVDVALLSSVLPYLREPYEVLARLAAHGVPWLIIDRTPVVVRAGDWLCVQNVPAEIYGRPVSYPAWLFSETRLREAVCSRWPLAYEADALDGEMDSPAGRVRFRMLAARRPYAT